jgi:sterol desaturase/sphingolipid hydroxylase (fatty acid hydroxylase superfamily)
MQASASSPSGPRSAKGRLFSHPVLELLTRSSPGVIWAMYIPIIVGLPLWAAWKGWLPWPAVVGFFALGVGSWSITEYLLHRWVFHHVSDHPAWQRFHYLMHGFHHEYPRDSDHLFMPPLPSLVLAGAFFSLFWGMCTLLGVQAGVWGFFPGFMGGYLAYSSLHYAMHTIPNPPKALRPLWRHHHLHHASSPERAFGVSSRVWDRVFGTLPSLPVRKERASAPPSL